MGKHSDGCSDTGHSYDTGCDHSMNGHGFNPDREINPQNYPDACFPYSSLVETPQGKVQIGDISVGQMVWSFRKNMMVKRLVTKKLVHGVAKIMNIEFGAGETSVFCTTSHSFLTSKGYLALSKIVVGDSIVHVNTDGERLRRVTSITDTKTMEPVFNLYTQGEHNFIVDGYVAHNFTHFRALRTVFHRLLIDCQVEVSGSLALQR